MKLTFYLSHYKLLNRLKIKPICFLANCLLLSLRFQSGGSNLCKLMLRGLRVRVVTFLTRQHIFTARAMLALQALY